MFVKHNKWNHYAEGKHPYTDDCSTVSTASGFRMTAVTDGLVPKIEDILR